MKVELVDKMGDDLRVANVARVSFDKWKDELDDRDVKLINYLAAHEHTSPFRHVELSVRCEAPIFLARQLGKHQVGLSWNETSRRYVDFDPEFYYPDGWRGRPDGSIKQGSTNTYIDNVDLSYDNAVRYCHKIYNLMLDMGVAPEQARMILPQSMMTSWLWSGSLLAFFHVWRLRSDGHAQKEAQDFAGMIDEICSKEFPICWQALKDAV